MPLVGKVLWWDQRDGLGVIVDAKGSEFYFDSSVIETKRNKAPKVGSFVWFEINRAISGIACAHRITLPQQRERSTVEKRFRRQEAEAQA